MAQSDVTFKKQWHGSSSEKQEEPVDTGEEMAIVEEDCKGVVSPGQPVVSFKWGCFMELTLLPR